MHITLKSVGTFRLRHCRRAHPRSSTSRSRPVKDWRGETLTKLRKIIHDADPDIVEELKWKGTPVFSHDGVVVLFKPFKDKVKLTFAEGAPLPDPKKLFNSMLEGNRWWDRLPEGEKLTSLH